jgi:putative transposase
MEKDKINHNLAPKGDFDFETFKTQAIKEMYEGKPISGEKGIFAPLLKYFLETALEAELQNHLQKKEEKEEGNRKNGKTTKKVRSLSGEFALTCSRDRNSTFEPRILPKREVIITHQLEEKVIALYGKGMSLRDISEHIKEIYQMEISPTELSSITDKIIPAIKEWQTRPLQPLYCFLYLDCIHYRVRYEGKVVSRAIYNILAVDTDGKKELIGMYISESEGAKFWLNVLNGLKNRELEDVLIVCVDGLKGFPEAIETVFPKAQVQLWLL